MFKLYLYLPPELRMRIVDFMSPIDRCRFAMTSKLCCREAKLSKNYLHSLSLDIWNQNSVSITIIHAEIIENNNAERLGYILHFGSRKEHNFVQSLRLDNCDKILWEMKLDCSIDIFKFSIKHFENLLNFYQNRISKLDINNMARIDFYFKVENVKNLEELVLHSTTESDNLEALSKTRRPLRFLEISGKQSCENLAKCTQIYQVHEQLIVPSLKLDFAKLMKLSASTAHLNIGNLTEQDLGKFIEHCVTGRIKKKLRSYCWECEKSDFNVAKLFSMMKGQNSETSYSNIIKNHLDFRHPSDARKVAELQFYEDSQTLQFTII